MSWRRRGIVRALLAATGLALAVPSASAAPSVDGSVRLESDLAWRVFNPRVAQKWQNRAEGDVRVKLDDAWSLRASGWLLWDPVGRIAGPDPESNLEPVPRWTISRWLEAELRELYAGWNGNVSDARVDVRVGKQQVVWGQAFGLRVLDFVNPLDFREFVLDEFEDARIPTWGVTANAQLGSLAVEALLFPDFEPDVLPDPRAEFALAGELRGLLPGLAAPPGAPPAVAFADDDLPDDWDPASWGWGLHLAGLAKDMDWGLYYWDRIDPRGAFERRVIARPGRPPVNELRRSWHRVRSLGFSFSGAAGSFTLWGEGAFSHGRAYVVDDPADRDGVVKRPDLEYALGVDWTGWSPLFANLQLIQLVIFDHDDRIELQETREYLSVLLRFELLGATLYPQLFAMYGTREKESMIRPSIEWFANDRLSITLGADLFTGPAEGVFGQYARPRECVPTPSGGCLFDPPPPGRTSRVYLRFTYELGFSR